MVRGYSVIANEGFISDMHFIDTIQDRFGNIIFSHNDFNTQKNNNVLNAFPWLDTLEMNINRPYSILKPLNKKERVIDKRISYLMKDVLKGFMKNGVAGRKSKFLNRDDIGCLLYTSDAADD